MDSSTEASDLFREWLLLSTQHIGRGTWIDDQPADEPVSTA